MMWFYFPASRESYYFSDWMNSIVLFAILLKNVKYLISIDNNDSIHSVSLVHILLYLKDNYTFGYYMLRTYFDMCTLLSLFTWILFGFPTCEIALNYQPQTAIPVEDHGSHCIPQCPAKIHLTASSWCYNRPACVQSCHILYSVHMRLGELCCENGDLCCLWML